MTETPAYLGIDFGTSGCRAEVVDAAGTVLAEASVPMPLPRREHGRSEQDPSVWWQALTEVMARVAALVPPDRVEAIAVDGTSGTLLLCDAAGRPLGPALMYDDRRCTAEAEAIGRVAPVESAAHGSSSALARLLYLQARLPGARHALHQADWIAGRLCGHFGTSDENNALKLGYDPQARRWPEWMERAGAELELLPRVLRPGTTLGTLHSPEIRNLGYSSKLRIVAGTTDGVAAFLATGAKEIGDAVTSLGSTLVLKVLSSSPIFVPGHGIYSHPCGGLWLAGGASNSGGAVLLRHFTVERMIELSARMDMEPSGLDYYPLAEPGERFPHSDPQYAPRLEPRPADDAMFLKAMFEGMARIEALGYRLLAEHGAPSPRRLMTVGGGARNAAWTRIRERELGLKCTPPNSEHAAYGTALIAAGLLEQPR
ncbi:MAG: FGGY-family carbohydrate kinase [Gammaproteobacteria bacterium]|jgi:sugar (pentulose or hexulose) kinase|nr:FGGY-family carbohydrate kinase [Gammaproteobacteria bacterium]